MTDSAPTPIIGFVVDGKVCSFEELKCRYDSLLSSNEKLVKDNLKLRSIIFRLLAENKGDQHFMEEFEIETTGDVEAGIDKALSRPPKESK